MKKLLLILSLMAASSLPSQAENRIVTDTVDGKKRVIELQDNVVDGQNVTDTLSITTYEGKREPTVTKIEKEGVSIEIKDDGEYLFGLDRNLWNMAIIPIVAIVFVFGLPALLIFIIFYFRYKNRKAKYRLAEQALASGQQLPPEFFESMEKFDLRSRGIKNIFLGIGLFIFLWALTDEFGLGCIGLLIMFTGFGQLVTYYTRPENRPNIHIERDETTGQRRVKIGGIEISDRKKPEDNAPATDETPHNDPQQ